MVKKNESQESKKKSTQGRNADGQFTKGRKKTGGRAPGTPNRNTSLRDAVKEQCAPLLQNLGEQLMMIADPKDRLDALSKFVPFFLPKFSSTTISADTERPIAEEDRLLELDQAYTKRQTEISIKTITVVDNDNSGEEKNISAKDLGL